MPLTRAQIDSYWEQGYLLVPDLVAEPQLAGYEQRFLDFALGLLQPPSGMTIMRDVMVVKGAVQPAAPELAVNKALNFHDDAGLYAYTLEPRLLAAVRMLIGKDLYSLTTNVFNKPPGVDGRHPLHQDLRYFRLRPADGIVCAWTALTRTSRHNGCLAVIPGSHKGALLSHGDPDWEHVNYGFFGIDEAGQLQRQLPARRHVPMRRGETLLFHPLLIHGSGHNASAAPRRAISTHFASASCNTPDPDWRTGEAVRRIDS